MLCFSKAKDIHLSTILKSSDAVSLVPVKSNDSKKNASPLEQCSKQTTFFVFAASFFLPSISKADFE